MAPRAQTACKISDAVVGPAWEKPSASLFSLSEKGCRAGTEGGPLAHIGFVER